MCEFKNMYKSSDWLASSLKNCSARQQRALFQFFYWNFSCSSPHSLHIFLKNSPHFPRQEKKNYYHISASKCEYIDFFHLFPIGEISIIFIPFDEHLNHNLIKFVESFIKRIVSLWLGRCGEFWENFLKLLENWKIARKLENC